MFVLLLCAARLWAQTVVPTSTYFLTDGDGARLLAINGGTYTSFNQGQLSLREYMIAVYGTITTGAAISGEVASGYYSLDGNFLGPAGVWTLSGANFWDGTTDGTYNYAFNFGMGGVYRFNRDWSAPVLLNAFGSSGQYLGITYDFSDNTLWLSGWNSNQVAHIDMAGNQLGSFTASAFGGSLTSLALDPADGTLWMGSQNNSGVFAQYTRAGVLLGTHNYGFTNNTLGGEFNLGAIPEPPVAALLAIGAMALGLRRGLRRRA